jgi:hypothetical protein
LVIMYVLINSTLPRYVSALLSSVLLIPPPGMSLPSLLFRPPTPSASASSFIFRPPRGRIRLYPPSSFPSALIFPPFPSLCPLPFTLK